MEIKFRWVGLNKHFNEIQIQEDLTTEKILNGETLTFFSNYNRGESGNCKFISEDLFSGLTSIDNSDAYLNDIIEYQNTEGKVFYSHLWFDNFEKSIMVGGIAYHQLFNSAFIQPSKLEFKIIGSIYTLPHYKYPQVSDGKNKNLV